MRNKLIVGIFLIGFLLLVPNINALSVNTINIISPQYITEGEYSTVYLSVSSDTAFNGTAYLTFSNLNSSVASVSFSDSGFRGVYYNYSWIISGITAGEYSIFVNLTNSSGETIDSLNKTGVVNSSSPIIVYSYPSGTIIRNNPTIVIRTNEIATCRYDILNTTYENLTHTFTNTAGTNHNQTIADLNQGENVFYVRCKDDSGHAMQDSFILRFTVDFPPNADIVLSDPSPIKAGTIEIKIVTSENLESAPNLEYSFDDSPSARKQISLSGSNSVWTGYLIISALDNSRIGTFYYSATDSSGNIGTKINSGGIFIVDTIKPLPPQSVKANSEPDGSIRLSWYYDGEETDYFNIYRGTGSGIDYVDFYAKSNGSMRFNDKSTIDKVTYYYKISAVDKAGNEGSLSEELYATSVDKTLASSSIVTAPQQEGTAPKILPPNLVPVVDTFLDKIAKSAIDVEEVQKRLRDEKDVEKSGLIIELGIMGQVGNARLGLESLRQQTDALKNSYSTKDDLEQKLQGIDLELRKIGKSTPKDLNLLEKSEFIQSVGSADIENAVNELFKDLSPNQKEKNDYIRKNENEKDKIRIDVSIKEIGITYLDSSKSELSLVNKRVAYQSQKILNDALIIETIPKSVAQSVNDIEFMQQFETLKDDPIVKFGFLKFSPQGEDIKYRFKKRISIDEFRNSKTVLLMSPNNFGESASSATGFSVVSLNYLGFSTTQTIFIFAGIAVIIILSSYYMFFIKGFGNLFGKRNRDNPNPKGVPSPADMYSDVRDVKAEMADRLLPLLMNLQNKKNPAMADKNAIFVNGIIDKAHSHLDNNSYYEAVQLYPRISFLYQNLPKEEKTQIYERCSYLHKRINNLKPLF